jgi:hypothetical protein
MLSNGKVNMTKAAGAFLLPFKGELQANLGEVSVLSVPFRVNGDIFRGRFCTTILSKVDPSFALFMG